MADKKWREKCGCVVTDAVYKSFCEKHKAEWQALHAQAQADYRAYEDARTNRSR